MADRLTTWIVGENTFGKPVGQVGIEFCDKILRPTSFRTKNAAGFSDATNVVVADALPTGYSFVSAAGDGAYDDALGEWTLAALAAGGLPVRLAVLRGVAPAVPAVGLGLLPQGELALAERAQARHFINDDLGGSVRAQGD